MLVRIVTNPDSKRARSFDAHLLGYVCVPSLATGSGNTERPVWAYFVAPEQQMRAFAANLRLGHVAQTVGTYRRSEKRFEFLKTARHQHLWQSLPGGIAGCTVLLPDLFRLDPGMVDPEKVEFAFMLPTAWLDQQPLEDSVVSAVQARSECPTVDAQFVQEARLFAAYLDRRTRCPIINDPVFHSLLYIRCIRDRLARRNSDEFSSYYGRSSVDANGTAELGYRPFCYFWASHQALEAVLAEETSRYYAGAPKS